MSARMLSDRMQGLAITSPSFGELSTSMADGVKPSVPLSKNPVKKSSPAVACLQKAMEQIKSKEAEAEKQRTSDIDKLNSEKYKVLQRMKDQFQAVIVEAMGHGIKSITFCPQNLDSDMKSSDQWGSVHSNLNDPNSLPTQWEANSIPQCRWRFPSLYPEWGNMMISIWNWWLVSKSGFAVKNHQGGYTVISW
jgi:hypothetical protein